MTNERLTADLVRQRYPWLSHSGVKDATEPTEYFVRSMDNALWQRECAARGLDPESQEANDTLYYWEYTRTTNAKTLGSARRVARRLLKNDPLCLPVIYRRIEMEMTEERYKGLLIPSWHWEKEMVEEVE